MSGLCRGATMFMNVTQPCGHDAYDDEGYCEVHLVLMLRQENAKLKDAIWHNMVDADTDGTKEELVKRFIKIWTPEALEGLKDDRPEGKATNLRGDQCR